MNALRATLAAALAILIGSAASAQQTQVYAGSNDNPDPLINASFTSPTMTYGAEVANTGSTTGLATTLAFNQVRVFKSNSPGCSLVAQAHNNSNNVSIYVVNATGVLTQVPGSPFTTGAGTQSLAWAPDGGALYVPLALAGSQNVVTLTVSCTAGGAITVTNAGTVALTGFDLLRDAEVIGTGMGTHLCVTGTNTNNVGCVPILGTRLPGTTAVNTITVTNVRGMRIAGNNCGIAGSGSTTTVQGFTVSVGGMITVSNTGTAATSPRYGAISADGTLAAFGGFGTQFTVFSVNASCQLTLVGSNNNGIATTLVEYLAFDGANRLYVSDSLANQIRVFAPTSGGIGAALSTSLTNHATINAPGGIDAALLSSLPVELIDYSID
ncbi:MAG TPA: hypothetical protein VN851_07750 [Thermoanaerobaculia bacterium]|nr:hypothetical protein [Thermoanaerobaculia bacterium]